MTEDTFKSAMIADIGLDAWYLRDIGAASGRGVSGKLQGVVSDPVKAQEDLARAMDHVSGLHRQGITAIRSLHGLG